MAKPTIEEHAIAAAQRHLLKNYAKQAPKEGCARPIHGVQHACRVAYYIVVFANLYRKYGHPAALELTAEELELIQIAALFHDTGRQDDGEDYWDNDSALNAYDYLIEIGKSHETAKRIAEVIANKDTYPNSETVAVLVASEGQRIWHEAPIPDDYRRSMAQTLLNDADRIDILRVLGTRGTLKVKKFDFYKLIVKKNPEAMGDFALVRNEIFSLISQHGDLQNSYANMWSLREFKYEDKLTYEHAPTPFNLVVESCGKHLFLQALYADNALLDEFPARDIKERDEMNTALDNHCFFSRAVDRPVLKIKSKGGRSRSEVEIDKAMREKGNPFRSISLLGDTCPPCGPVGFLINALDISRIQAVQSVDSDSGLGSKKHLTVSAMAVRDKEKALGKLSRTVKRGGKGKLFSGIWLRHSELLYDLHNNDFQAIYIHMDKSTWMPESGAMASRAAITLQAIYLQNNYFDKTRKRLPIVEYSSTHNFIKEVVIEDAVIIAHWISLFERWAKSQAYFDHDIRMFILSDLESNVIKMSKIFLGRDFSTCEADDLMKFYSPELKQRVLIALRAAQEEISDKMAAFIATDYLRKDRLELNNLSLQLEDLSILSHRGLMTRERVRVLLRTTINGLPEDIEDQYSRFFTPFGAWDNWNQCIVRGMCELMYATYQLYEFSKKENYDDSSAQINSFVKARLSSDKPGQIPILERLAHPHKNVFELIEFLRDLELPAEALVLEDLLYKRIQASFRSQDGSEPPMSLARNYHVLKSPACDHDRVLDKEMTDNIALWIQELTKAISKTDSRSIEELIKLSKAMNSPVIFACVKRALLSLIMDNYVVSILDLDKNCLNFLTQSELLTDPHFVETMLRNCRPSLKYFNYDEIPVEKLIEAIELLREHLPGKQFTTEQIKEVSGFIERWGKLQYKRNCEFEALIYAKLEYLGQPPTQLLRELADHIAHCHRTKVSETNISRKQALLDRWDTVSPPRQTM